MCSKVRAAHRRVALTAKGSFATRALLSPSYAKQRGCPPVATAEEAHAVLQELLNAGLFLRARSVNNTKFLQPDMSRVWSDEALYAWIYEGSQLTTILGGLLLLAALLAFMLFPLWPTAIRSKASYGLNFAMYAGMGIVALLVGISIVRMLIYIITYFLLPRAIWIFPNLWEDCGVLESFVPLWEWEKPAAAAAAVAAANPAATTTTAAEAADASAEKKTN